MGNLASQITSCFRGAAQDTPIRISINCACFHSSAVDQCDGEEEEGDI